MRSRIVGRGWARRSVFLVLVRVALLAAAGSRLSSPAEPPPSGTARPSGIREVVEVRLVQIAVSVIDPKSSSFRSVPGLTLDQFDIRLDGKPLTPEERQKVFFDPICDDKASTPVMASTGQPVTSPVIAVVDFNYVDAAGREKVARALEDLAAAAKDRRLIVKVYGLTRQVRQLTNGFTNEAPEIRKAAESVRKTAFSRGGVKPGEEGIPPKDASSLSAAVAEDYGADAGAGLMRWLKSAERQIVTETKLSDSWGDSGSVYDPGASLAALEGILRAHTYLPGRKAVVLFTSEAFRFSRTDRVEMESRGIEETARSGFTIWTVDVAGLSRQQTGASELMSMLGADTGGGSLRNTGDLAQAWQNAAEQMSCYYLISLPVAADPAETVERNLIVKLDTTKFKDLWSLRVHAPTKVTVVDRATAQTGRRIAALLSPTDFSKPPVSATLEYPALMSEKPVFAARLRTPLSALSWEAAPEGGVRARVLVEAVVERDNGRSNEPVCEIGAEKTGALDLRLAAPPRAGTRAGLSVALPCVFKKNGVYTARGVVTDVFGDTSGGGRSTALIQRGGSRVWAAHVVRVEGASGLDFVWGPGMPSAQKDRERRTSRTVSDEAPADPGDRLLLRYVLCGPDRDKVGVAIKHLLVRRVEGGATLLQSFAPGALHVAPSTEVTPSFCAPASVTVPEFTLEPGRYGFAVLAAEADPQLALSALTAPENAPLPAGVLAIAPFAVANAP